MSQSNLNLASKATGPVECLGQKFSSEEARREHYLKLLAQKLKDPEFRKMEGFPIGKDEDILTMSDPPYYTACLGGVFSAFGRGVRILFYPSIQGLVTELFRSCVIISKWAANGFRSPCPFISLSKPSKKREGGVETSGNQSTRNHPLSFPMSASRPFPW
jgi:hypothetical protein